MEKLYIPNAGERQFNEIFSECTELSETSYVSDDSDDEFYSFNPKTLNTHFSFYAAGTKNKNGNKKQMNIFKYSENGNVAKEFALSTNRKSNYTVYTFGTRNIKQE